MKNRVVIVNYGMGNLHSVKKKLQNIGAEVHIVSNGKELFDAEKIVLPGVGHFEMAVENLKQRGFWDSLTFSVIEKKIPILGICLGMQLMAKHSEEGTVEGLGWIDAEVVKFRVGDFLKYKVPHTGWNQIIKLKHSSLMCDIPDFSEFYFVHSYHFKCSNPTDILNETDYEYKFTSAVEKENIFGVQYHPEKSHNIGEKLLKNFVNL